MIETARACGEYLQGPKAPMSRLYSSSAMDHAYSILPSRIDKALKRGYRFEKILADFAVDSQDPECKCLEKFHRLWHPIAKDHFYTVREDEVRKAIRNGYTTREKPDFEGYCVPYPQACGATVPIHRFYSEIAKDHFYTMDEAHKVHATSTLDYRDEGIECYAWEHY